MNFTISRKRFEEIINEEISRHRGQGVDLDEVVTPGALGIGVQATTVDAARVEKLRNKVKVLNTALLSINNINEASQSIVDFFEHFDPKLQDDKALLQTVLRKVYKTLTDAGEDTGADVPKALGSPDDVEKIRTALGGPKGTEQTISPKELDENINEEIEINFA